MSHGNEARTARRETARVAFVPARRECASPSCMKPFDVTRGLPRMRFCSQRCAEREYLRRRRIRDRIAAEEDEASKRVAEQLREAAEARQMEALRRKTEIEAAEANTYGPGLMGEALYTTTMQLMRRAA